MLKLFLAISLFGFAGTAALAHPLPKAATPKPDTALATSPKEIRIGFSEGLELAFSGIEVDDKTGKSVATGDATIDPNDDKELIVPIKVTLAPGTYTVKWHAVGIDTHRVSGHYSFQVKAKS